MGSYATLHFFRKLIDAFPAQKEWERPRIIVDNNCVMPSRVRAILYGENCEMLVASLADSIRRLLADYNVDMLVLACNTSHYFLPQVRRHVTIPNDALIDLIDGVANECRNQGIEDACVVATEGTIASKIYDSYCRSYGITVTYPGEQEQTLLREFIEDVKQSRWDGLAERFTCYVNRLESRDVIIGCTELSVICDAVRNLDILEKNLIDPVQCAVKAIRTRVVNGRRQEQE